tara:strand:+ start:26928 stop:27137 length:210 start_codon:yes stop_codon:yes gene_type:complete
MKILGKVLFVVVFIVSTVHAVMYKQWWAFGILVPIAVGVEWDRRIKSKFVGTSTTHDTLPRFLNRKRIR